MTSHKSRVSTEPAPGTLGAILASTTKGMADKLAEIRESLDHAGEKGTATEEIVAEFLTDRLPQSIRATSGQVMDRTGRKSGQVDVVLYDATALRCSSPALTPAGTLFLPRVFWPC